VKYDINDRGIPTILVKAVDIKYISHLEKELQMKRLFSLLGGGLGLLVLVGLVAALFFSLRGVNPTEDTANTSQSSSSPTPAQSEPTPVGLATATRDVGVFQSPLPPPIEPTLTPPPTPLYQPPTCKFEGAMAGEPETPSRLEQFVFSEPKVILEGKPAIEIIEWLPDNQHLLLHIRNQPKQSIETLDTTTGQTQVYADNLQNARQIHWVAGENAIVYTDHKTQEFSGVDQYSVRLSRGKGQQPQLLLEDAKQLQTETGTRQLPPEIAKAFNVYDFPFDPEQWRYQKYPEDPHFMESWAEKKFAFSVSPDSSKAFFYGIPWLYLVDLKTGQPCEIDLGKNIRATEVAWSPDSRLLAMLTTRTEYPQELWPFSHLVFLNVETGEVYQPDLDILNIWEMAWASNSRYFIAMGETGTGEDSYLKQQLTLVDVLGKDSKIMLPDYVFGGAQPGFQLALSPDNHELSVSCPMVTGKFVHGLTDAICLISTNLDR
jgi:hypothetical protein